MYIILFYYMSVSSKRKR